MPTNVNFEYENAEKKFHQAQTTSEKLKALQEMLSTAPSHKGGENLRNSIKQRIAKIKDQQGKQSQKSGGKFSIKKEGSATIAIIGIPNSGKSTLLKELTKAKVQISSYPFTTIKPEVGIMDYHKVKIQVIELPAIVKNYTSTENGNTFLGILRLADLIVLLLNLNQDPDKQIRMIKKELREGQIDIPLIIHGINKKGQPYYLDKEKINDSIWKGLNLIKIYTKMPGKPRETKPISLEKGSTIRDLATHVHKDFLKDFTFARVWGNSVKFARQRVGLEHKLKDDDIVELHLK